MEQSHKLNIAELDNYLQTIFDLESSVRQKDFKIALLEFELELERLARKLLRVP